jgi:hypothetical protein
MHTVDDKPETIHLYVVREEAPKPQLFPIFLSVLALLVLVVLSVAVPYQQPVTRLTIRVPAVLLPSRTFTAKVAIIPTGVRVYPATTAHGVLTITNGSIIGQYVPAGFTVGGVATDTAIYVPPGNANGYGWAQVSAHAGIPGKNGNIPALAINSVIGSSVYVRNLSAFSGGRDAYSIKVVTDQDKQTAEITARNILAAQSVGLHYPCQETKDTSIYTIMYIFWRCQYVTFSLPSYMHVSSVRIIGKNLLIQVWFVARPVRVGLK